MRLFDNPVLLVTALVALPLVIVLAVTIWAFVDAVQVPSDRYQSAGIGKAGMLLVIVLLGIFGAMAYFFLVKPRLTKVHEPA